MRNLWGMIGAMIVGLAVAGPAAAQDEPTTQQPAQVEQNGDGAAACPGHAQMAGKMAGKGAAADGCPADCPMHQGDGTAACPGAAMGGCPVMDLGQAGATVQVEETDRGAVIRIDAPQGDQQARDQVRDAAELLAQRMEQGCPMMKGKQKAEGSQPAPAPQGG